MPTLHAADGRCRHAACGARGAPVRRARPQLMPTIDISLVTIMYAATTIKSIDEGLQLARRLPRWIFRGQGDSSWDLSTRFEREAKGVSCPNDLYPYVEKGIIYDFQRRAHHYLNSPPDYEDEIEWLSTLQHHGGPSRLLDFTRSFYVAAYFAVESPSSDADAVIWAFNSFKYYHEIAWPDRKDISKLPPSEINNLALGTASLHFGFDVPEPGVMPLEPRRMSERLAAQQGCFIFPYSIIESFAVNLQRGLMLPKSLPEMERRIDVAELLPRGFLDFLLIKIIIPNMLHRDMLVELAAMNITSATLFPGIDGFAKSLWHNIRAFKGLERLGAKPPSV